MDPRPSYFTHAVRPSPFAFLIPPVLGALSRRRSPLQPPAPIHRDMSSPATAAPMALASPSRKRVVASADAALPVAAACAPLQVQLLSAGARLPTRGSAGAAGYDLYASEDATVAARGRGVVATDISVRIPEGTYARIAPRSGLAVKKGIQTGAGVVDFDYRGKVGVVLFNHSDDEFVVKAGDRVAQMILERIVTPEVVQVDELDETVRGSGGFGSTGVSAPEPKRGKA